MRKDWFQMKQVTNSIYAIDDHGEDMIYLVTGSEKSLLIDTGWGIGDLGALISKVTDLPLIVVNTHGHPDHGGGNCQFSNIHIAEEDIPEIEGCFSEESRRWAFKNVLKGPYPKDFSLDKWISSKPGRMIPIKDKHGFDLGNKVIEVISLPGHSPGSIALLDREERVLFSGDSILQGTIWMHLETSTSLATYLQSLKKLSIDIGKFDTILPGHTNTPLKSDTIYELIAGVEDIIRGRAKGKAHHTFAGNGLLYKFGCFGLVYNRTKL